MISWDLEQYLHRISDSRRSLWACLQDLDQEELTGIPVEGRWTTKDLIGHITAWDISLLNPLKTYGYNHGEDIRNYKPDAVVDSMDEIKNLIAWG